MMCVEWQRGLGTRAEARSEAFSIDLWGKYNPKSKSFNSLAQSELQSQSLRLSGSGMTEPLSAIMQAGAIPAHSTYTTQAIRAGQGAKSGLRHAHRPRVHPLPLKRRSWLTDEIWR